MLLFNDWLLWTDDQYRYKSYFDFSQNEINVIEDSHQDNLVQITDAKNGSIK